MQPILFLQSGDTGTIGSPHLPRHFIGDGGLHQMGGVNLHCGFVENAEVTVISQFDGNLIVNVKDSRVAVNKEMARHIMV